MSIGSSKIGSSGTPSFLSSGLSSEVLSSTSAGSSLSQPSGGSTGSNPSGGSGNSNPSNPSNPSGGSSVGSSASNPSGGAGSSDDGISYVVSASVGLVYSPGWSVVYMLTGQKVGAAFIQNNGETAGGLTCEWAEFPPPNEMAAVISGAYSTEESFNFTYYPSETETLSIARIVQVQNTGDVDIVVNGSVLAPGDTAEGLNTTDVNPWDYVYVTVNVTKA